MKMLSFLVFLVCIAQAQESETKVVAERKISADRALQLTVDSSDLVQIRLTVKGQRQNVQQIGVAIYSSGSLDLKPLIPDGMIATQARRFNYGDETVHVVIAFGFGRHEDTPIASLFVFDQRSEATRLLFQEPELGQTLEREIYGGDFGGQGRNFVAITAREGGDDTLTLYAVNRGEFKKIQSISGYNINGPRREELIEGPSLWVESKPTPNKQGSECMTVERYIWSAQNRFVKRP